MDGLSCVKVFNLCGYMVSSYEKGNSGVYLEYIWP